MTKIKICGITNLKDAQAAADLGADYIGFNFYIKSPRFVDYKVVRDIISKLNGKIRIVGVFVNESADRMNEIADTCTLDLIQLSGDENNNDIIQLREKFNTKTIKTFRIKSQINNDLINSFDSDYILIDSSKGGFYGGTGESLDLDNINGIDNEKLFLAGGLNERNVKLAIEKINPFAVDVCSGIESSPGKKDYDKMKKFIEAVL